MHHLCSGFRASFNSRGGFVDKQKLSRDEVLTKEDVAKIFDELATGLRAGGVTVSNTDNAIFLTPSDEVSFSMDASEGKGKGKVKIGIKWKSDRKSFATDIPSTGE